ncbi:hypothetical protein P7228_00425 [Altererythrobacter arenosus]|uniref:Lipoprotein n=1 Tax=Altererythrobacter arenosus TaxID=3032592 RepID=A0ABY8FRB7_9SPHN|nr:hypothetical protein [Altererythrobacter sp. CAU 1644]WFL77563.1 hypothetical protein P7228_00425 [Altererythrobacter sp. CAU 1644]
MDRVFPTLMLCSLAVALASCAGEASENTAKQESDPLLVRAINLPLMTDPELVSQNEANAALTIGYEQSLPPIDASPAAIATASDAARIRLIEGGQIPELPRPIASSGVPNLGEAVTSQQRAEMIEFSASCAPSVEYSAIWAARLPKFAEIVPRGAVVEAAGTDRAGCKLRSVTYLTPLPVEEALTFHYTVAQRSGLAPQIHEGPEYAIRGKGKSGHLAVHLREREGGLLAVDIVTLEE